MKRLLFGTASLIVLASSVTSFSAEARVNTQTVRNSTSSTLIAEATVLATGSFVNADKSASGTAKIINKDGKRYVKLASDFTTVSGPALKVILHNSDVVGSNIPESSYISVGILQETSGEQLYEIPANVDLSDYKSVAIWCEEFNVTFGYATLQ